MRISVVMLAAALAIGPGGNALADRNRCPAIPGQQWIPIDKVIEKA